VQGEEDCLSKFWKRKMVMSSLLIARTIPWYVTFFFSSSSFISIYLNAFEILLELIIFYRDNGWTRIVNCGRMIFWNNWENKCWMRFVLVKRLLLILAFLLRRFTSTGWINDAVLGDPYFGDSNSSGKKKKSKSRRFYLGKRYAFGCDSSKLLFQLA
jgi:hypothetical protein